MTIISKKIKFKLPPNYEKIMEDRPIFTKYTSPYINMINGWCGTTRPRNVGQLTEVFKTISPEHLEEFESEYDRLFPDTIIRITSELWEYHREKVLPNLKAITRSDIGRWLKDLLFNKTFIGLYIQNLAIKTVAEEKGRDYELAVRKDESLNIDGFIEGVGPVSVKPVSFKKLSSKPKITIPIIYWEYDIEEERMTIDYNF